MTGELSRQGFQRRERLARGSDEEQGHLPPGAGEEGSRTWEEPGLSLRKTEGNTLDPGVLARHGGS